MHTYVHNNDAHACSVGTILQYYCHYAILGFAIIALLTCKVNILILLEGECIKNVHVTVIGHNDDNRNIASTGTQ